jgi:hypothetical protein
MALVGGIALIIYFIFNNTSQIGNELIDQGNNV